MLLQKSKRALGVNAVAALKKLNLRSVLQAQLSIKPARLCVFIAHPGINADAIQMTSFDHERSWEDEISHFGVIKRIPEIPVGHLPFDAAHEAKRFVRCGDLMRPLVEITGTD